MNEADRKRLLALARTGDMDAVVQGLKDAGAVERPIGDGTSDDDRPTNAETIGPDIGA